MNSVLEGFQKLFDKAKSAPAKDRACFSLPDPSAPTFTKNQHYLQILVNEMYLAKARQWWIEYDPVVLVVPSYIYGSETSAVPMVVGPMLFKQYSNDIGYVCIYGVFGSIGHKKAVKGENVHVMEVCITQ